MSAIIGGPHRHRIDQLHKIIQERPATSGSPLFGKLSGMCLQEWNLGVFDALKPRAVEVVFLQPAFQLLESSAADAEDRQGLGDRIVVPNVDLRIEVFLIYLRSCLLVEPILYVR